MAYQTYTVKGGDSLSKIAQQLGLSGWQDLYNLNRSVIGANPNLIRPGQTFNIPGTQQVAAPKPVVQATPKVNPVVDTARQYTDPLTGQLVRASEIPQFENVMPFMNAWNQMVPQATQAAVSQINPESQRQFNQQYRDYMYGMTGSGGERFGRGLSGVGTLKAAAERDRQAQLQDWLGSYQKGFQEFFYEPSRSAWNSSRTQVQPGETFDQTVKLPTWNDLYQDLGSTYGVSDTSSPFYG